VLPQHPWLKKCVEQLNRLPQIQAIATTEPYYDEENRFLADGRLSLTTKAGTVDYVFVVKGGITVDSLESQLKYLHLFRQQINFPKRALLIADNLADFVVERLVTENVEFLDSKGSIYLNNHFHYILICNTISTKNKISYSSSNRLTVSILKLVFVLLQEPQRLQKCDRARLADLVGIKTKTVSRGLETLLNLEYLELIANSSYVIKNYTQLFERWQMGYLEILRNSLLIQSFRPLKGQEWLEQEDLINIIEAQRLLIGGEWGADLLTQYLHFSSFALHLPEHLKIQPLMLKLRLVPDPVGNIIFLRQFGKRNHWWLHEKLAEMPVVDPLLIYAELMVKRDDRLKEVAKMIYEKYILPRQKRAEMM
jgi:hypothetical protein